MRTRCKAMSDGRLGRAVVAAALAGLAAVAPSGVAAQDVAAILGGAERLYAPVERLCANFRQHRSVPLLREEHEGHGRLCQARPDRFAMRFTDPAGDVVVMDGRSVWVYWPSSDPVQVLKLPVGQGAGGFDLHREFLSKPMEKYRATYRGKETVGGRETHVVRLVPREPKDYVAATVWIDSGTPHLRQVRLEEENGSVRTITLSDIRVGAEAPSGFFSFTPPAGAQVIS